MEKWENRWKRYYYNDGKKYFKVDLIMIDMMENGRQAKKKAKEYSIIRIRNSNFCSNQ